MKKLLKILSVAALLGLIAGAGAGAGMFFGVIDTPESIAKLSGDDDDSAASQPDAGSTAGDVGKSDATEGDAASDE